MISPEQWDRFFSTFAKFGVMKPACEVSGIGRRTVYNHIEAAKSSECSEEDRAWYERYKEAEQQAADVLEEAMFKRGVIGVDEPLIGRVGKDQDGVVAHVKRYSDALLVRLAMARRPEKFRDKVSTELSGPGGGPIETKTKIIAVPTIDESAPE